MTKKRGDSRSIAALRSQALRAENAAKTSKKAAQIAKQEARAARKAYRRSRKVAKKVKLEWQRLVAQLSKQLRKRGRASPAQARPRARGRVIRKSARKK